MRALFDLQPRPLDSDYELAFRRAEGSKRALVVVFCDLLEEAAARPLVEAVPGALAAATRSSSRARRTRRSTALAARRERRCAERGARATVAGDVLDGARHAPPRRSARRARGCSRRRRTGCPRCVVAAYLRAKARAVL